MRKTIVKVTCFVILLVAVMARINYIFSFKNNDYCIYTVKTFYELPQDSIDVLVLGSSHAFNNISAGVLWDEHGIAAYDLGGSKQPLWNTYYYLKEALKTQSPKLILLEGYTTITDEAYGEYNYPVNNTYGMRMSKNKLDAIEISFPKEEWIANILEYPVYHSRYSELTKDDFEPNLGKRVCKDWKGSIYKTETATKAPIDVTHVSEFAPMFSQTEEYYRKIIELAQENDIPISVVIAPFSNINEDDQKIYNTAEKIAAEYGISFINYNLKYEELNIDFEMDFEEHNHLNYSGSEKFTKALGTVLDEQYELPDRRGLDSYQTWENNALYLRTLYESTEERHIENFDTLVERIRNPHNTLIISCDDVSPEDIMVEKYCNRLGIPIGDHSGVWAVKDTQILKAVEGDNENYLDIDGHDAILKARNIYVDDVKYFHVDKGINVIVYNDIIGEVIDSFGLDAESEFSLVRRDAYLYP